MLQRMFRRRLLDTTRRSRLIAIMSLLVAVLSVAACSSSTTSGSKPTPTTNSVAPGDTNGVVLDALTNIKTNGYDSATNELYINWRYGTSPLQTNFNGSGNPDGGSVNPPRKDPLTDLRYLHNLLLYKNQHPSDTQFDGEIAKFTPIVQKEVGQNEHGWVYDELIGMSKLSQDAWYKQAAHDEANYFFTSLYNPTVGTVFKKDSGHPNGHYRVDLALEVGGSLVQQGTIDNRSDWVDAGRKTIAFVFAHAYVPQYHVMMLQMDNVLNADGSVNTNETIDRVPFENNKIEGGSVKMGEIAQEALSLLHASVVTKDQKFLDDATNLLDGFTADNDPLGMWDKQNGGWYSSGVFPGPNAGDPGKPKVSKTSKESGRQFQMLEAFRVANTLTNNRYAAMQSTLLDLVTHKAYYAAGHGYTFQETPDWQPLPVKNSTGKQDWVTTEAMGITLESIQSVTDKNPW